MKFGDFRNIGKWFVLAQCMVCLPVPALAASCQWHPRVCPSLTVGVLIWVMRLPWAGSSLDVFGLTGLWGDGNLA